MGRVGISMARDAEYAGQRLRDDYWQRVAAAGGTPLLLPPLAPEATPALLDTLDAVLLSGGGDPDPALFDEAPLCPPRGPDPARDAFELALARGAWQRGLPVLGICRGMQMLCLALGGSLHQDIPLCLGESGVRHDQDAPRQVATHRVFVCSPRLAAVLGVSLPVNSCHHQAVNRLPPQLLPAAYAADGVLEAAIAAPGAAWACGVQWHPEALPGSQPLFDAFVRASGLR